jgi:pimeloyl-ACP methyl ester carboxylesterase
VATFVLVHGSWQGAWAWAPVVPVLELAGHTAEAVDLPEAWGQAPGGSITLAAITQAVVAAIERSAPPVILVGHSGGGVPAAAACEQSPDRIAAAVYLCAFLLRDGESIEDFYAAYLKPWMRGANRRATLSADGLWSTVDPVDAIELFYHCSPPAVARAAAARLTPQPVAQSRTQVRLTEERFGRVPRYYIEALQDRSVHLELQRTMHARQPCREVFALDTDHAPQLSAPGPLAAVLLRIAAAVSRA